MIERIQAFFEKQAFGVCEYLGNKLGIRTTIIRKYFIYLSFITLGSPLILYLIFAFFLENRSFFRSNKHSVWDL
ncbi:MAG: PspC domain-containing protein [Salibacteraceae bacterium]|nr:PspC domain-containing protein [Salibacteraceae bacterium]